MKSTLVQQLLCFVGALLLLATPALAMGHDNGPPLANTFDCPVLSNTVSNLSICSGDNTRDLSVSTTSADIDIQFVYFTAPQTGSSMYVGGTPLGTVASADFLLNGVGFDAVLSDVVFPTATATTVYYVYARVDPDDPDVPDSSCRPFVEMVVTVNPTSGSISCNSSIQVSLDDDGVVEVAPQMLLSGTHPDYNIFTVSIAATGGNTVSCAQVGLLLDVKVTNTCSGNFCWGKVRVQDKLSPVLLCEDVFITCAISDFSPTFLSNALGLATAVPLVQENCGTPVLTHTDTWVDLGCGSSFNGQNDLSAYVRRRWSARDGSGNTSTCIQYVYLQRRHVQEVIMPADTAISCDAPSNLPAVTGAPYLEDFGLNFPLFPNTSYCELNAGFSDQILPNCGGSYKILRKWTVYEWCLPVSQDSLDPNPRFYTQVIEIKDEDGPSVQCPLDFTVTTNQDECCANVDLPDVILEDNCSNLSQATAKVTIVDYETGEPLNTFVFNGSFADFPNNNYWTPDTMAVFGSTTCLPTGDHEVEYTFLDDCGNLSDCFFILSVQDGVPPIAACDGFTQVSLGLDSIAFLPATTLDDGSYDNCSPVWFKVRRMEASPCYLEEGEESDFDVFNDYLRFCCEDVGAQITAILRVYDVEVDSGIVDLDFEEAHSTDCMVQVLVEDKLPPTCIPPPPVTVSCENFDPALGTYGGVNATDNCCLDTVLETRNYTLFDTTCNRGTIVRRFRTMDCSGNSSQCTQRIVVDYRQHYFIRFPDDVVVNGCNSSGNYGTPIFFGEDCELLAASFKDDTFVLAPDACRKIERTWTVINWCTHDVNRPCVEIPNPSPHPTPNNPVNLAGPVVSAPGTLAPWSATIVKINATDPAATNYSSFWNANANCYVYKQIVKIVDTQVPLVEDCPSGTKNICDLTQNDTALWNRNYWWDATTESHNLCEGPADLKITATDACTGADLNFRYLLFLDLNQDGVMETVVNSNDLPPANTVFYGNALNPNYSGGEARSFDNRAVSAIQKYRFALQTTTLGNKRTASLRFNTVQSPNSFVVPELPYGRHKIKWVVADACGNEQVCEYVFVVRDCKKPTVLCKPLTVNLMQTGMVTLWASDFLVYADDNCTPASKLSFGVIEEGVSTGVFPVNPSGIPIANMVFDCDAVGTQVVQLWARDLSGNADFCSTYVIIQDNSGICAGYATVAGALKTVVTEGVEEAQVDLIGAHPALPPINLFRLSDNAGAYQFSNALPLGSNYVVKPIKDDNPINGVTTLDIALISKHILGTELLDSPYKIIAADANNTGTITTFDVVEIRKLILGMYDTYPENKSWRFVDAAYVFPVPTNPFFEPFPESISVANLQGNQIGRNFLGIKIGDVNNTAEPNKFAAAAEDRTGEAMLFEVYHEGNGNLLAGQEISLTFSPSEPMEGFQFTLQYPGLELLEIEPGSGMTTGNFAVFPDKKALTTSFNAVNLGQTGASFTLRFKTTQEGLIHQLLHLSSCITKAEAYPLAPNVRSARVKDLALRFHPDGGTNASRIENMGFEVYPNQPNPFIDYTNLCFYLPEPGHVSLAVFDETGRTVHQANGTFPRGYGRFLLRDIKATGMLYYRVETTGASATGKMVRTSN